MRDMERAYFDAGAASIDLMERAAAALCDELLHALAGRGKTCVFACGTGGNGGDGYAAARLFAEKGGRAIILPVGQPRTTDAIRNCERARGAVFAFADVRGLDAIPRPDAWADCLFGIGLSRAPEGPAAARTGAAGAPGGRPARLIPCCRRTFCALPTSRTRRARCLYASARRTRTISATC